MLNDNREEDMIHSFSTIKSIFITNIFTFRLNSHQNTIQRIYIISFQLDTIHHDIYSLIITNEVYSSMSNHSSEIIDLFKPNDYDQNNGKYKRIRIVVVSDTHEDHRMIKIPDGDILLHCGDFTNRHHWLNLSDEQIPQSLIDFNQWLGQLPHRYKIVIGGNHDVNLEKHSQEEIQSKYLTNCIYLRDQLIKIEGISIYGCSWVNL